LSSDEAVAGWETFGLLLAPAKNRVAAENAATVKAMTKAASELWDAAKRTKSKQPSWNRVF
jgi:hypothetical protein